MSKQNFEINHDKSEKIIESVPQLTSQKSRRFLDYSNLYIGKEVWVDSFKDPMAPSDPKIPSGGIAGKIYDIQSDRDSYSGNGMSGYTTKIKLSNGETISSSAFNRFFYLLYEQ